jgi:hypothetical protein
MTVKFWNMGRILANFETVAELGRSEREIAGEYAPMQKIAISGCLAKAPTR